MENDPLPATVTLDIETADRIARVFIGYETTDGTEHLLASAAPPAKAELNYRPQTGESSDE
jgi:hypothetical protein